MSGRVGQRDSFDLASSAISTNSVGLSQGYAFYDCLGSDICLRAYCAWDNGG